MSGVTSSPESRATLPSNSPVDAETNAYLLELLEAGSIRFQRRLLGDFPRAEQAIVAARLREILEAWGDLRLMSWDARGAWNNAVFVSGETAHRVILFASLCESHFLLEMVGPDEGALEREWSFLNEEITEKILSEFDAPGRVSFWISYQDAGGGASTSIVGFDCPMWDEVRGNYPRAEDLEPLVVGGPPPPEAGGLIIWYGPPGTGKTRCIWAMAREWGEAIVPVVITDPAHFLADKGYYYDLLEEFSEFEEASLEGGWEAKRCLFVLEDSGRYMLKGNRFDSMAMESLLNMTDGMFSQGRKDLFLVTFNVNVEELDEAVLRPGRCVGVWHFPEFKRAEAQGWLECKGLEEEHARALVGKKERWSLAELYQLVREGDLGKRKLVGSENRIGFG